MPFFLQAASISSRSLPGRAEPLLLDLDRDGRVVEQDEVVLERGGELGVHDRGVAPLLLVEGHDHAAGVLVEPAEAGLAQDLIAGLDGVDAERLAGAGQVRRAMIFSTQFIGRAGASVS
jgi:hypothetical protein